MDAAKKLNLSVVGIGGKDILDGNRKLTMSILWQLMHYDTLKLLTSLAKDNKEIADADILAWANAKLADAGKGMRMTSFKDKGKMSTLLACSAMVGQIACNDNDSIPTTTTTTTT